MNDKIIVKGAREQNLKNIDVEIPRNQLVVLTGLSGSGKSSLAFETIYAEGQRRYVESLSAYARQFLGNMEKPDVDSIEGLSPAISIDQKTTNRNPRSTVGTVTEIYDYLRLLFARIGKPVCPVHGVEIKAQSVEQMVDRLYEYPERTRMQILAPMIVGKKGTHVKVFEQLKKDGYVRVRVDGEMRDLDDEIELNKNKKHTIEVVVDRIAIKPDSSARLADSLETALKLGAGKVLIDVIGEEELVFSEHFSCPYCDFSVGELEPRMFSFNSPFGACPECSGLGVQKKIDVDLLIPDPKLSIAQGAIRGWEKEENYARKMLDNVCRHYGIDLDKPFEELTDKEKQIILYGTTEPIHFLLESESGIKQEKFDTYEGVVNNLERRYMETNSSFMREWIEGFMSELKCKKCQGKRLSQQALSVLIDGKNINLSIPMGVMNVVTGVSGSGKSTLINDILYKSIATKLYRMKDKPGAHKEIKGLEFIEKIIDIDQSPIGRTPRSNPATYTGVFDDIRDLFAATNEAKVRGYQKGRFSFNVKGGRCEACRGDGLLKIEMHFLPDVYVPCEVCHGKRYNRETLSVTYRGKNIADVLEMTVEDAYHFFEHHPKIARKLKTLCDVGLGYLQLGQPASTLSGGEAQRVKLASELHRRITDKTVYILDEPTTGLHVDDVRRLLKVLERMVDEGATIVIIEHNLDVIKMADYIIDLGPEGGNRGGTIVAKGTPEEVANVEESYTGKYLKKVLERDRLRQNR